MTLLGVPLLPLTLQGHVEQLIAATWLPLAGIDADDLRQEALVAFWQVTGRFRPGQGASLRTYSAYRMRGRVQDVWRATTHRGRVRYVALPRPWEPRRVPAPDWRGLRHAVNALPAAERLVVIRSYWSGWTLQRIARRCGWTPHRAWTVRRHALRRLRRQLGRS
jgi:DNA-directed RNA polymerase specialized sigma24 family protein